MPIKILSLLVFLAACDETAAGVQRDYVDRHKEAFVFHVDRAQVIAGLRGVFADDGLELIDPTTDPIATTESPKHETYAIHVIATRGGHLVHIVSQLHDDHGKIYATIRDTDKEWELAQRLEPDRALDIEEAANKRADHVAPRARSLPSP